MNRRRRALHVGGDIRPRLIPRERAGALNGRGDFLEVLWFAGVADDVVCTSGTLFFADEADEEITQDPFADVHCLIWMLN